MKTIYKYPLRMVSGQIIEMPIGAQVLTVQMQGKAACIWVLVDTDQKTEPRMFFIYGTGQPIATSNDDANMKYIGTYQEGQFVWHVFEKLKFTH